MIYKCRYRHEALFSAVVMCLLAVSLLCISRALAESSSTGAINISAGIPSGIMLDVTVIDQLTNSKRPSLGFGELQTAGNEYRGSTYYKVLVGFNPGGEPAQLVQTCTPLVRTGTTDTIPEGAFTVKPTYSEADNHGSPQPTGSILGPVSSAVGTKVVYSDPGGNSRIITLIYTLSGDPGTGATESIPLTQKSGAYSATIQFTLTS